MEIVLALTKAFVVGGMICVIAQLFIELTPYSITPAHIYHQCHWIISANR